MSIVGIGIDLCDIDRVAKSLKKHADLFADKILHPAEKIIYQQHKFKAKFLAKRFAAKEAFAKAMGTGIADGVILTNIEVYNNELGKPLLRLHGSTLDKLQAKRECQGHLSISDEVNYAIAQVIIEKD